MNNPIHFTPSPSALVDTGNIEFRHLDWTEVHIQLDTIPLLHHDGHAAQSVPSSLKIDADPHFLAFTLRDTRPEGQGPVQSAQADPAAFRTAHEGTSDPSDAFLQLHSLPAPIPPSPQSMHGQGWDTTDTSGVADGGHSLSTDTGDGGSSSVGGEDAAFFTLHVQ